MRSAVVCALLAALAVPVLGQAPTSWQRETMQAHPWPETSSVAQQFAASQWQPVRADLVRFDAAARLDAVLLRSVEYMGAESSRALFVLRDVARAHAVVPLGAALDFAVVPCGPGQQGVLALQADGALRLHRWPSGQAAPTTTTVASWPGYRRIAAVRNGGATELVGFDFAGLRIRRAAWSGAQLGPATNVATPSAISFVAAMDWNQDGATELVLGGAGATFISAWNNAPIASLPVGGPTLGGVTLRCVSRAGAGDQLVSVVSDGANTMLSWANAATSGAMMLGAFLPGAVTAFDRDADGDDDLVIADAAHGVLRLLVREPHGYRQEIAYLPTGPTAPNLGVGAVAAGDLDGDRDGDVLAWNRNTLRTHTVLDAALPTQRPLAMYGDVFGAAIDAMAQVCVSVDLPQGFALQHPVGASFQLRLDGWLVDPLTGFVRPQRATTQTEPVVAEQGAVATTVQFALPPGSDGLFQLQLHAALVAVTPAGETRTLPSLLVHMTNDPAAELAIRAAVADERFGGDTGKGDGGGDGNIAGAKTGKHQISEPPQ